MAKVQTGRQVTEEEEKQIALSIIRDAIIYARLRGVHDAEMLLAVLNTEGPTSPELELLQAKVEGAVH